MQFRSAMDHAKKTLYSLARDINQAIIDECIKAGEFNVLAGARSMRDEALPGLKDLHPRHFVDGENSLRHELMHLLHAVLGFGKRGLSLHCDIEAIYKLLVEGVCLLGGIREVVVEESI